jgi:hypothetical protein
MQRSDDDGFTWQRVGDPIVDQDGTTADSTFNNDQGELQADPTTGDVLAVYAAGRNLLDLFEDAIDPVSGKLAVIYADDRLTTDASGSPLPQVVLAQQN